MRSILHPSHLATVVALAGTTLATAEAQTVGFEIPLSDISRANMSWHTSSERRVITTAADYDAWFRGSPPATPPVDFSSEVVLAIAMGAQWSAASSTEIARVVQAEGGAAHRHWGASG